MIEGAVYHNGKVALRYYQPIPKFINVSGKEYVCNVQHGVSVVLVDESEVPAFLSVIGGCCGGQRKLFALCGQEAFNVWATGNR